VRRDPITGRVCSVENLSFPLISRICVMNPSAIPPSVGRGADNGTGPILCVICTIMINHRLPDETIMSRHRGTLRSWVPPATPLAGLPGSSASSPSAGASQLSLSDGHFNPRILPCRSSHNPVDPTRDQHQSLGNQPGIAFAN